MKIISGDDAIMDESPIKLELTKLRVVAVLDFLGCLNLQVCIPAQFLYRHTEPAQITWFLSIWPNWKIVGGSLVEKLKMKICCIRTSLSDTNRFGRRRPRSLPKSLKSS